MRSLILLAYIALINALMISSGLYNKAALLFVIVSFGLLLAAARIFYLRGSRKSGKSFDFALLAALLFSIGSWFVALTSIGSRSAWYENMSATVAGTALVGVTFGYLLRAKKPRVSLMIWLVVGALPVILWLLLPQALPSPPTDVYYFHQGASAKVLDRINPYHVTLGTPTHFDKPAGYVYPPGVLYPLTLSYYLTGDVRYGQAVFMAAAAVLLWLAGGKVFSSTSSALITLLFLYHPWAIFALDRSFTETLLVLPLALLIFLSVYRLIPAAAAVAFGYFVSLKPYLVFLPLQWLIIERRAKYLLIGLLGAAAPIVPFLGSDFAATINNGFLFNLEGPFRADSLTAVSFIHDVCGCSLPVAGWSLFVGSAVSAITFWFFRKRLSLTSFFYAVTIVMFSIFLLGRQAFGNYYYLVSVMLLALIIVSELDYAASSRRIR